MDEQTGRCAGCGRTLADIAGWGSMNDAGRMAVLQAIGRAITAGRRDPPKG